MKDQSKFFTYFIVLLSIVVIGVGGFFAYGAYVDMAKSDTLQVNTNEDYPLRKNATDYQKTIHAELKAALKEEPQDKVKIAELVSKNYIADYYTWSNKIRFNDVGGLGYVSKDIRSWVYAKSLDTFYNDVRYYLDTEEIEKTLEVEMIDTSTETTSIMMDEKEVVAYSVDASWKYKSGSILDTDEFQSHAFITVVENEQGLISVVEVNINEENEE
ncbi:hypothetical protein ERUR111494_03420 [Erysipelothrix urinaevulpis]|uniref:hypothetical protein n=1 Tax=Erysipelothrix urinaevulpis TaxID=2683717 RepID=UPI00135898A3|nr:hypothetical protein [Erysipelothrix urinaevulpis]